MDFRSGIEVYQTLFVSFAEHHALPLIEVNVIAVECHQFSDTHARGCQQVDDRQIPQGIAIIPHLLQRFVRVGFFDNLGGLYFVDPADRAFYDVILILQPRIEGGQNATDVIDCHLAGFPLHLVCSQILPNVIRGDPLHWLADRCCHGLDRFAIVGQRLFGAALDALGCDERCRCICLFLLLLSIGLCNLQPMQAEFHSCTKFAKLFVVEVRKHLLLHLCD